MPRRKLKQPPVQAVQISMIIGRIAAAARDDLDTAENRTARADAAFRDAASMLAQYHAWAVKRIREEAP